MKLLYKAILLYLVFPVSLAFANPPIMFTVNELLNGKQLYNGLVVQFQGEAIGQRLSKTSRVWVNILDDEGNAIGAYLERDLSNAIQHYGTYQTTGDRVLIEGIFHTKCEEHGGDTDIHVQKLQILQTGAPRQTDPVKHTLLIGCFLLTLYCLVLFRIKKKKIIDSE